MVYKREIPLVITFLVGIIAILEYYVPVDPIVNAFTTLKNWGIVISAFALGLGAVNLFRVHGRHIMRRTPGQWYFSAWLLFCLIVFVVIGLGTGEFDAHPWYKWLYNSTMLPLGATMYAGLCFAMTAGAYRVLRARSFDAALLLITAFLVILGNTPMFSAMWRGFFEIREWIFDAIVGGTYRGIRIGVGLGSVVLGIRTLIGLETGYLGRR